MTSAQLVTGPDVARCTDEVTQDPQPAFQGGVAERAPPGPAGTVPLAEFGVAERGDGAGQPSGDGVQETVPPGGGPAAGLITGQGEAAAGEERGEGPPGRVSGPVCPGGGGQELPGAGGRVSGQHPACLPQDRDSAAGVVTGCGERGRDHPTRAVLRAGRAGQRDGVAERPVGVSQLAPVA